MATNRSDDDFAALLDAARSGSSEALDELFRTASTYFRIWSRRHKRGARSQARFGEPDLFQAAAVEALEHLSTLDARDEPAFLMWMERIFAHKEAELLRRHFQTQKRDASRETPLHERASKSGAVIDDGANVLRDVVRHERAWAVKAAVRELPDRERRIVVLHIWRRRSFRRIAAELGERSEAIRSAYRRVLRRLRAALGGNSER